MTEEQENMEMKKEKDWEGMELGWGGSRAWIWGLALILFGGLWLLEGFLELDFINAGNWWVIFLFVGGLHMIANGWERYRHTGRWVGSMIWGFLLIGFGLSFLFEVGWEYIWPAFLIIGGLALLIGSVRR